MTEYNNDEDDMDNVEELDISDVPITISVFPAKKANYLNNKDMLLEIHRSKNTFCEYTDQKYSNYDIIVESLSDIFLPETLAAARVTKAAKIASAAHEVAILAAGNVSKAERPKLAEFKIQPDSIPVVDLVFRVLCHDHIPLAPGRKKTPKSVADNHVKLNFHPFKHFIIENNQAKEVGRSHSRKGKFCVDHGCITNTLAKMFILLVNKYGQRGNWRNYTYLEEMKGQALLQLTLMGLQFDEAKSENPFAYFSQSLQNSFTRVFNQEKKNQDLRDDLLIDSGASPSFSRQLALEDEIRLLREDAQNSARDIDD